MHKNNFDFLRLLFASFVIITHSYLIIGKVECDWICQLSGSQLTFSTLGVKCFFIISGFLIFQSLQRSKGLPDFFWKRVLRLYPALIMVLLLTVLLAPLVYVNAGTAYLSNKDVWTYVPHNLTLFFKQYTINGVFEKNPYKGIINGSLWTLPYEFSFYIATAVFYFIKNKIMLTKVVLSTLFLVLAIGNLFFIKRTENFWFVLNGRYSLELGLYFTAGALLAAIEIGKSRLMKPALLVSAIVLIASIAVKIYGPVSLFLLPVVVICFGLNATPYIKNLGDKIGDLSYGVYIYGFPVEQTVYYYFKPDHHVLAVTTLIISLILAYLSWHFIESKALKLKNVKPVEYMKRLVHAGVKSS